MALFLFSSRPVTTSTTRLTPSSSSSTVPPMPALAKLVELPTYTGFPVLRASNLDSRVAKSRVPLFVKRGVLNVSAGETRCSHSLALFFSLGILTIFSRFRKLTFGIANTNEPIVVTDGESGVVVVRKSSKLGPLSVSCRWTLVCGAFGNGKATSIGSCDGLGLVIASTVDIVDIVDIIKWRLRARRDEVGGAR